MEELIGVDEVQDLFQVGSRRSLNRLIAEGKIPKPDVRVGAKNRWKESTVTKWIELGGPRRKIRPARGVVRTGPNVPSERTSLHE